MTPAVLIALVLLFLLLIVEGVGIVALFRQVGFLHLALEDDGHQHHMRVQTVETLASGTEAPYLAGISVQGEPVALPKLLGQRVLVAFVHPLCEPCNLIGPELETLYRDVTLNTRVIVVSDGDRISTEEYVAEHHLTAPVLYEPRDDYAKPAPVLDRFKVPRTPFAYLLDERHHVVTGNGVGGKEFFWHVAKGLESGGERTASTWQPSNPERANVVMGGVATHTDSQA